MLHTAREREKISKAIIVAALMTAVIYNIYLYKKHY